MLDGEEEGLPPCINNISLMKKGVENFDILDLYLDIGNYRCLQGKLKEISWR